MNKKLELALLEARRNKTSKSKEDEAKEFLRKKAKTKSKENLTRRNKARKNLLGDESKTVSFFEPGGMYLFQYDAKYKDILPYWDYSPIIIPFDVTGTHILGLNLHYLPPQLRARLLDAILDIPSFKDDKKRQNISYNIIKSFAQSDIAKPTIHKYLLSHVVGNLVKIDKEEWNYVAFLPLADWRSKTGGVSSTSVYADSKRKI